MGAELHRIRCACSTCRANNGGKPLEALVPSSLLKKLGGNYHGTVWSAHEPGPLGDAVRAATGIKPDGGQ